MKWSGKCTGLIFMSLSNLVLLEWTWGKVGSSWCLCSTECHGKTFWQLTINFHNFSNKNTNISVVSARYDDLLLYLVCSTVLWTKYYIPQMLFLVIWPHGSLHWLVLGNLFYRSHWLTLCFSYQQLPAFICNSRSLREHRSKELNMWTLISAGKFSYCKM